MGGWKLSHFRTIKHADRGAIKLSWCNSQCKCISESTKATWLHCHRRRLPNTNFMKIASKWKEASFFCYRKISILNAFVIDGDVVAPCTYLHRMHAVNKLDAVLLKRNITKNIIEKRPLVLLVVKCILPGSTEIHFL